MSRSPAQGMESFAHLFESVPMTTINAQAAAAWSDVAGLVGRMDKSVKEIQVLGSTKIAQELRFRKKVFMEAISELSALWINGYVYARAVYGTVLTDLHYSRTEEEVSRNGQRLIDFAEGIDVATIFVNLPEGVNEIRASFAEGTGYTAVTRKLATRQAEAALLTSWATGVATGIAEHELFFGSGE